MHPGGLEPPDGLLREALAHCTRRWATLRQLGPARVSLAVWRRAQEDNLFNAAAALPFYLMLALFPALSALLSLLPYLPIERVDEALMSLIRELLPAAAAALLHDTVAELADERRGGLLSISLLGTLWAASTGMYGIMRQLNITYRVREARPFLRARATALVLTLLFGLLVVSTFALVVLGGVLQDWIAGALGRHRALLSAFALFRFVVIGLALILGFGAIYSLAPNRKSRFEWLSPGALLSTLLLISTSSAFRLYVENFGNYTAMYGGLGAAIVLMLWLYSAGLVLLLGSEVNAIIEERCAPDCT